MQNRKMPLGCTTRTARRMKYDRSVIVQYSSVHAVYDEPVLMAQSRDTALTLILCTWFIDALFSFNIPRSPASHSHVSRSQVDSFLCYVCVSLSLLSPLEPFLKHWISALHTIWKCCYFCIHALHLQVLGSISWALPLRRYFRKSARRYSHNVIALY